LNERGENGCRELAETLKIFGLDNKYKSGKTNYDGLSLSLNLLIIIGQS
jgi:hypothetical protein